MASVIRHFIGHQPQTVVWRLGRDLWPPGTHLGAGWGRPLQAKEKLSAPYLKLQLHREVKPMRLSEKFADDLRQRLLQIPEPRMARCIRHRKVSVLATAICAIMSNARNFAAIAEWAKGCSQNMLKRLGCRFNKKTKRYVPPSEPTIWRFLQMVNAEAVAP